MAAGDGLIFVSYRREDSADITGRIFDRLEKAFDRERLFRDVDSIPLGVDFRKHIREAVARCDVMLAIIGPTWNGGAQGSRLDEDTDFVRIEIQCALDHDIPIIPVLVHATHMPKPEQVPESLRPVIYRNAISIRSDPDFHRDVDRLVVALQRSLPANGARRGRAPSPHTIADPVELPGSDVEIQVTAPPPPTPTQPTKRSARPPAAPDDLLDADEWVMDAGALSPPPSEESRLEDERPGRRALLRAAVLLLGVGVAVAVAAWVQLFGPLASTTGKATVATVEPAKTPPLAQPTPLGGLAGMPAARLGMTRPEVHAMLGKPKPESMFPENGRAPTFGRAIDAYSLPDAAGGRPISLSFIYAYDYAVQPEPGRAFEETAMQVDYTVAGWPGADVLVAKLDEIEGVPTDRLSAKLSADRLTALASPSPDCVNLQTTDGRAARLLWKTENGTDYLYVGVWKTLLHPQDNRCR